MNVLVWQEKQSKRMSNNNHQFGITLRSIIFEILELLQRNKKKLRNKYV
jgi:hypothetical protein